MAADNSHVAVIAVHGVGQHLSGASAEAVSTLLLSIGREGAAHETSPQKLSPTYSAFTAKSIGVPLRPVQSPPDEAIVANDRGHTSLLKRLWGIFDERRGYLAASRQDKPLGYKARQLRPNEPDRGEYGYQFMLTQLAGYRGDVDRNFQTVRLEGTRGGDPGTGTVHIYDAHYSDLTKPESSILAFFFSFYQLLFHLASLSLLAVYWTEAENVKVEREKAKPETGKLQGGENGKEDRPRIWRWRIMSSVHATSVRLLTMAIPILNLVLLEIASSAFIDKTHNRAWLPLLALFVAAVLSLGATFFAFRQKSSPSRPFLWAAIPFVGTALGTAVLSGIALLYNYIFQLKIPFSETLLLLCWLLTAGLVLALVASKFDPLRPGALALSTVLYAVNLLWFLIYVLPRAESLKVAVENQFATASLWAVQWIFGELLLTWILCLSCALLSWPLSAFCKHGIKDDPPRAGRATAAFRTGRFAFSIPAILFVIVTCALWAGVVVYGSLKLKAFDGVPCDVVNLENSSLRLPAILVPKISNVEQWINRIEMTKPTGECTSGTTPTPGYWSNYLDGLLLVSVTPGLPVTMTTFAVVLLLLIWAVLPSVIFELKPEWTINAGADRIRWLGEWLSRGLDNTAILTRLLWLAIVPVPLFFFALDWHALHYAIPHHGFSDLELWVMDHASRYTLPLIEWEGLALALSAAAILGFILKYLTTVLDTILDVDNYLRTSPLDRTPRALIAERCASLLRYIADYRDDQKRTYSKVIIVAHSLGSLVTTDLLRYLERSGEDSPDPDLARYDFRGKLPRPGPSRLPIYVFSMGSPLRQLLNRFFPHLYWWVSDIPDNSLAGLGAAVGPPPAICSALPRSDEMNVTLWSNAYRSGDYIGRSLWVGQWLDRNESSCPMQPPDLAKAAAPRSCCEMCIGLGAHTHYWDRSAPEIAAQLDHLICCEQCDEERHPTNYVR